jgi:hypothetical protein
MDNREENYIEINDNNITFYGDTPQEQETNKWLYHTILELNRYQDMTQEVLNYISAHKDIKEVNEIYQIIKEWQC